MHDWRDWLSLAGFILGIGGLVVTLVGLDGLASDLFPNRPLPHRQGWSWVKGHVRRQKPPAVIGVIMTAEDDAVASMRAVVTRGRPDADASHAVWVDYWDSEIKALGTRLDWLTEDMKQGDIKLGERLTTETAERTAADAALAERLHTLLGGEDGKGLVIAWWGIAATFVGALLQGIASIGG